MDPPSASEAPRLDKLKTIGKGFNVALRTYWPKDKAPPILDGTWKLPAGKQAPYPSW